MRKFPSHPPLEDPTPGYNCHADVFIDRQGNIGEDEQVQTIIRDHKYYAIKQDEAKNSEAVFYYEPKHYPSNPYDHPDELWRYAPNHIGKVVIDESGNMSIASKPSGYGFLPSHDPYHPEIVALYGKPVFVRTDRPMGHRLHETPPPIPESD
ncbi:hypothetical protein KSF_076780 [Reticulibacter mediterranei]|uniref:Uncharacterized protein n=1 Tax=Reticulibacter mediterranei TaxID=2778369 RepID=A0A8J3N6P0_9CHLR|nr:hypothetical protein [Reticulibacter mediterranei]GHO97630.1 hypothetical protein KSF_076780 [Reticulibacter mediterranei]